MSYATFDDIHAHPPTGGDVNIQADQVIVYGADWCPWTTKQKEDLDKAGVAYKFVDCVADQDTCSAEHITGFPTIQCAGEKKSGYRPAEVIKAQMAGDS